VLVCQVHKRILERTRHNQPVYGGGISVRIRAADSLYAKLRTTLIPLVWAQPKCVVSPRSDP
jgi:hypothetical protein